MFSLFPTIFRFCGPKDFSVIKEAYHSYDNALCNHCPNFNKALFERFYFIQGMKSKVSAKTGGLKYQWQIMKNIGLNDDEIKK